MRKGKDNKNKTDLLDKFGDFLYKNLKLFEIEPRNTVEMIEINSVPLEMVKEILFKFLQYGYIAIFSAHKDIKKANDIGLDDCFYLTVEGKNYIEKIKEKKRKAKKTISNSNEEKISMKIGDVLIQIGNVGENNAVSDDVNFTELKNIPITFGMNVDDICEYIKKFANMSDVDKIRLCQFAQDLDYFFCHSPVINGKATFAAYADLFQDYKNEVFMVMQPYIHKFF